MKLLILSALVALAAASNTYDKRDYGYQRNDYGRNRIDYGYGRRDYGYDRGYGRYGYDRGYDRYGYDRGYGYDRYDRGYDRYDNDYAPKKDDYAPKKDDIPPKNDYAPKKDDYAPKDDYKPKESYGIGYQGKYTGKCGNDGLYYRDEKSFVFCSNGNSYVQPCAPGTRNSSYKKYSSGAKYSYRDFCDINLVDDGYGVSKGYGKKDDRYDRH